MKILVKSLLDRAIDKKFIYDDAKMPNVAEVPGDARVYDGIKLYDNMPMSSDEAADYDTFEDNLDT